MPHAVVSAIHLSVILVVCLAVTILTIPWWLNVLEQVTGRVPSTEISIRCYIGLYMGLSLVASLAVVFGDRSWRRAWQAFALAFVILLPIAIFDDRFLLHEASWIRYPTAGTLLLTGVLAGLVFFRTLNQTEQQGAIPVIWLGMSFAATFLAADELLEIHEFVSRVMGGIPILGKDWTTVLYAVAGMSGLAIFMWLIKRTPAVSYPWVVKGYLAGIFVFALSQVGDSLDDEFLGWLRTVASHLAEAGHEFPDVWFVVNRPTQLFNDVEEVLELTAGLMILMVTIRVLVHLRRDGDDPIPEVVTKQPGVGSYLARAAFVGTCAVLLVLSWPHATRTGPFSPNENRIGETQLPAPRLEHELEGLTWQRRFDYPNETMIRVSATQRALLYRIEDLDSRFRLRRMLKGLKGMALTESGEVLLLTGSDRGRSFMPDLVWSTGLTLGLTKLATWRDVMVWQKLSSLVDEFEANDISTDEFVERLEKLPADEVPGRLQGSLRHPLLLNRRETPYEIGDLTVEESGLLVVAPGVSIQVREGAEVFAKGRFYAMGTKAHPISISGAEDARFDSFTLSRSRHHIQHTALSGGRILLQVLNTGDNPVVVRSSRFDYWSESAVEMDSSDGLQLLNNRFGLDTPLEAVEGEAVKGKLSAIRIAGNVFGQRRRRDDVIDIGPCEEGQIPQILNNRFLGGEDDAIDLDDCSALVSGNHITGFIPTEPRGNANGGGITGSGSSRPFIANNIIEQCYHGIGFKDGARPVIVNNTIVDCQVGITLYASRDASPGATGVVINNILHNRDSETGEPQDILLDGSWWPNYSSKSKGKIVAEHNLTGTPVPGTGNIVGDPKLERPNGIPTPGHDSPARDSGLVFSRSVEGFPDALIRATLAHDFLGQPRPDGGRRANRGAVETP